MWAVALASFELLCQVVIGSCVALSAVVNESRWPWRGGQNDDSSLVCCCCCRLASRGRELHTACGGQVVHTHTHTLSVVSTSGTHTDRMGNVT